jgi:hypothetical protein
MMEEYAAQESSEEEVYHGWLADMRKDEGMKGSSMKVASDGSL